ncbi:MAG: ATP-binding cassette domain-containing protein [Oscillospiraceae bacterium]
MNETIVSVRGVSKAFGAVRALQDVSLTVQQGMVTAIVGDNGSGKSTLIQLLSGNLAPDSGSITVGGQTYRRLQVRQALDMGIRTVYQDLSLDACKNSYENIFLGQELRRGPFLDRRRMAQEAGALLQQLEIVIPDLTVPVRVLSGGQRQGVAIARAMRKPGRCAAA